MATDSSCVTVAQAARYPSLSAAPAAPVAYAPAACPSSSSFASASASHPVPVSVSVSVPAGGGVPHLWPAGTVDTLRGGAGSFNGGVTLAPHTLAGGGRGGGVTG